MTDTPTPSSELLTAAARMHLFAGPAAEPLAKLFTETAHYADLYTQTTNNEVALANPTDDWAVRLILDVARAMTPSETP